MKKCVIVIAMLALCMGIVVGCSGNGADGGSSGGLTVTDDLGNTVTFDKTPEKIVSLAPATTEIVFALDAGEMLVGRTDYCDYPEEAKSVESIGNYDAPNIEKIVSLSPDLVLATEYMSDDVKQQVEATGAKVLIFTQVDIAGIEANIEMIAQVIDKEDKGKDLVSTMEEKRQNIIEKAKTVNPQNKVFIDLGSFYSVGKGSLQDSMLTDINAVNIAKDAGTAWPQLTAEKIIADNPDVYISLFSSVEEIKANPGFDQINAIKNNRLVYYDGLGNEASMMQRPGPRIVDGLELLAKAVYPDVFK